MSTSMSSALPENKTAGIALIAGLILTLFASLLYPGGVLIDSVDQTNFHGAIAAMSDNANITHAMTLLFIPCNPDGGVRLARARSAGRPGRKPCRHSFAIRVRRNCIQLGLVHCRTGLKAHGRPHNTARSGRWDRLGSAAQLQTLAEAVYSGGAAVHVAFLSVASVAATFLGLGLAARFGAMNVFKLAAYGMVLVGVVGLLNLGVAQHIHDIDLSPSPWLAMLFYRSGPSATSPLGWGCIWVGGSSLRMMPQGRPALAGAMCRPHN